MKIPAEEIRAIRLRVQDANGTEWHLFALPGETLIAMDSADTISLSDVEHPLHVKQVDFVTITEEGDVT